MKQGDDDSELALENEQLQDQKWGKKSLSLKLKNQNDLGKI